MTLSDIVVTRNLHPELHAELRRYRLHMLHLADHKAEIRAALSNPETAYLLLTRIARPFTKRSVYAMVKRRATGVPPLGYALFDVVRRYILTVD